MKWLSLGLQPTHVYQYLRGEIEERKFSAPPLHQHFLKVGAEEEY